MSESDWSKQLTDLATRLGWKWVHVKTSMYGAHFVTAAHGPLANGWPDLILVKPGRRPLAVELKRQGAHPRPAQIAVLAELGAGGFDAYIWMPGDFDVAARILSA